MIKIEFNLLTENEPVITKRRKKAPPSKIVRNRKQLKEFLEKNRSKAYNTGAEETRLGRDPGNPVFRTPTTSLNPGPGEKLDRMECEDVYNDSTLSQLGCAGDLGADNHDVAVKEFGVEAEYNDYIDGVKFHQPESDEGDTCHVEAYYGRESGGAHRGGQTLNDER